MKISFIILMLALVLVPADLIQQSSLVPAPVSAQGSPPAPWSTIFSDDFSQDLSQWIRQEGSQSWWHVLDQQLEAKIIFKRKFSFLLPRDEYWPAKSSNLEFELDYLAIQGADRNLTWGYRDPGTWYNVQFTDNGVYYLTRYQDHQLIFAKAGDFSWQNGHWYHFKVRLKDGVIQLWADNQLIGDFVDPSYDDQSAGKVVFRIATGSVAPLQLRFDNLLVRSLDAADKQLTVTHWSQLDTSWAEAEYDQAQSWTDYPQLHYWGCALTSLAMILNYHGFSQLPDAQPLNPGSLNEWLKSQPDGYVGNGLVNWLAGTRLTRILSQQSAGSDQPLRSLEFHRRLGSGFNHAIDQINQDQPVILQIPGHFLVSDGYLADQSDLYIQDPAFSYQTFNQHQAELLSTLMFKPSQTDLSYLMLVYQSGLEVNVVDGLHQPLATEKFTEQLTAHQLDSDQQPASYEILLFRQPADGRYYLEISQPQYQFFQLSVYAYDINAEATTWQLDGFVGPVAQEAVVDFNRQAPSQLITTINFTNWRTELLKLYQAREINKYYVWAQLDQLAEYAEQANPSKTERYVKLLKYWLNWHKSELSEEARIYLETKLDQIFQTNGS